MITIIQESIKHNSKISTNRNKIFIKYFIKNIYFLIPIELFSHMICVVAPNLKMIRVFHGHVSKLNVCIIKFR